MSAPPPSALIRAQDKLVVRRRFEALGAPVPRLAAVTDVADVDAFAARVDAPIVVETVAVAIDGRGVALTRNHQGQGHRDRVARRRDRGAHRGEGGDAARVAAPVARSPFSQARSTGDEDRSKRRGVYGGGRARARAGRRTRQRGKPIGVTPGVRTRGGGSAGSRTVRDRQGGLIVNELAMRPHNSGHWTMDGSRTSKFEQRLRAVLDYPLGDSTPIAPVTDGQCPGAQQTPAMSWNSGCAASSPSAGSRGAPLRQG